MMKKRWTLTVAICTLCFALPMGVNAEEASGTSYLSAESADGTAAENESGTPDFSAFQESLLAALTERCERTAELTESMADESDSGSILEACSELAQTEWDTLAAYEDEFDAVYGTNEEKNKEYIRLAYMEGLKLQAEADPADEEEFWNDWQEGFVLRAAAVMEILTYYDSENTYAEGLPADLITQMEEVTGEACEDNAYAIWFVQALTGATTDGFNGDGTRYSLKVFQEDNNLSLNGVINDDMLTDMIGELADTKEDAIRTAAEEASDAWTEKGQDVEITFDLEEALSAADAAADTGTTQAAGYGTERVTETETYEDIETESVTE